MTTDPTTDPTTAPATYLPRRVPPEDMTAPQLRVTIRKGAPVVELRYPNSNDYYDGWCMSYAIARRVYSHICSMRRAGRSDNPRVYKSGRMFGGNRGRRFKVCKSVVIIGCQHLLYSEIEAFAKLQGWPKLPKRKRA